jgi:predicted dehydrogenase
MNDPKLSRREMLRASAYRAAGISVGAMLSAGAGATLGWGSQAFAQPAQVGPPIGQAIPAGEKIRLGVIGTGHRFFAGHLPALQQLKQHIEIVAACDVAEPRLGKAVKRIESPVQAHADYQKLLASDDVDAVLIATPNLLHKEMTLAALQAGKHVLCEKPMAVSIDECRVMRAAGEASKQVCMYGLQLRYAGRWAEMRRQIAAGAIGRPKYVFFAEFRGDWNRSPEVWEYDDPKLGKPVNWRLSHAASGGTLSEKVCHYFDIMNWLLDAVPQRVTGSGGIIVYHDGRDTWDHATTTLVYPDGVHVTHGLSMFAQNRLDLQVIGEEGSLHSDGEKLILQNKGKRGEGEDVKLPEEVEHDRRGPDRKVETAVTRMYEDFITCIRSGKKPWADAEKAMAASKIAWLAELSARRKQEVAWQDLG